MRNIFSWLCRPLCLSVISGLLVFLSFPAPGQFYLIWIALVPFFYALRAKKPWQTAGIGLVNGVTASAGLVYWIYPTVHQGTGSAPVAIACLAGLAVYMGLYTAVWSLSMRVMLAKASEIVFVIGAGALWVALEYARAYVFNGFTWGFLGYSQVPFLSIVQIAEFTGVYGISFLIVFVNAAVYIAVSRRNMLPLLISILLIVALAITGRRLENRDAGAGSAETKVAVLQGNIDQYKKWDVQFRDEIRAVYERLSREAALEKPDVIVWPETSVPGWLPLDEDTFSWIRNLIRETGTFHIVGTAYALNAEKQYNASVLISPAGEIAGVHKKTRLVAFGEYIPMRSLIGRYVNALNETGDLVPGEKPEVVMINGIGWGANICSENFFGDVTRRSVLNGAKVIVNQTNDGWYGNTAQPRQHFDMNIFRAVETRRPFVVCANTGISAIVNPDGSVIGELQNFTRGYWTANITPRGRQTFYVRYGDAFVRACIAFCILVFCLAVARGNKLPLAGMLRIFIMKKSNDEGGY